MRITLATGGLLLVTLSFGGLIWQHRLQSKPTPSSVTQKNPPFPTVSENSTVLGYEVPLASPSASPLTDPVAGWLTFRSEDAGYSLSYPPDYDFETQSDGSRTLTKWGPTQQANTEFYDGVSLRFLSGTYPTGSLFDFVQTQAEALRIEPVITTVSPVSPAQIGRLSGWQYFAESTGITKNLYFPIDANRFLFITDATQDPTGRGFASVVSQILATLTLDSN